MERWLTAAFAALMAVAAPALEVVWDKRTPEGCRKWAERAYVREQMEVLGEKICKALYGDGERSRLHENFTITLYLAPVKGGNPAFASGRRITWKVGSENPGGDGSGGMGLLCHEMTHVLDMGSDGVFTEGMADWTRNYKVWYARCTSPSDVLAKRYGALRGGRHYGKYMSGANFIDFMTQNYGEGTIYRILQGYRAHGKNHWEKTFGKDFDALLAEWRNMETIYDPVFQWTYNGTAAGVVRNDKNYCALREVSAGEAQDASGAWLYGATAGKVSRVADGCMTIALHGRFPRAGKVAIASLGAAREGTGKGVLLATSTKTGSLAAHVVAARPGKGCEIVATEAIAVPGPPGAAHSVILSVKDGDVAVVVVDGKPAARVDMKSKCGGCTFTPAFAVGGMAGGIGVSGFTEPRGPGGVMLDDVRVFTRTFRSRETRSYAETFNADYRGATAVAARWCGKQGDTAIEIPSNWYCVNSLGEKIWALPSKETEVTVVGKAMPSIPPKAKFDCKSFTIDGLAIADAANIDLRGVRIVDVSDNARLITRDGHGIAVNALRANRVRLDGTLAVTAGMKLVGRLEMREGSMLRLPADPDKALVKTIAIKGDGAVTLKPGAPLKRGVFQKIMRMEDVPEDCSRFRLNQADGPKDATFKAAQGGKALGVTPYRRE